MAAINRPLPAHTESQDRIQNIRPNSGMASSMQQDPGQHSTAQDPGFPPHPQHPIFARPVVYIHAPPPPPLLHYQWPMPFSYNPFAGFPSMGYGMVVPPPPFPPSPYMDAPGYVLPHPHGQPVDYRRLPHPQTHTQSASHQNPNQTRRIRPNQFLPVREMVNSEVQTEPAQRGISGYELGSDSGRGTRSNSPCSPASSSPKQNSTNVVSGKSPCREQKDSQVNEQCTNTTVKTDLHKHTRGSMAVDSCGSTRQDTPMNKDLPDQEPILDTLSKDGNYNLWLSSSPDGILPVSSSSQKDNVVLKERRISVPDILMNWGDGTPQPALLKTTNVKLSQIDNRPSYKHDVEGNKPLTHLSHRSTEANTVSVVGLGTGNTECMESPKVSEMLFRVLRLPHSTMDTFLESCTHEKPIESFLDTHSLTLRDESQDMQNFSHNISGEVKENDIGTFLQEISDVAPHNISASSYRAKRKSNESIWSVESLPPFIPSKEWLLQNGLLDPKVNEVTEEDENVGLSNQNEHLMLEGRKAGRLSSSASVQMSNSFCSSIQEKQSPVEEAGTEMERGVSEPMDPEESQSMINSEKNMLSSSTLLGKAPSTPTKEDEDENGSPEPVATQSTNQNTQILNDLQHKTLSYSEEEMSPDSAREDNSSSAIQLISQNRVDIEDDEVTVMIQDIADVSPSKGTLVDCAVQCNEFQERRCFCGDLNKSTETNRRQFKSSDMKKANDVRNGHMQKKKNQWRSTSQDLQFNQQEGHSGYCRGKSKVGRNPRYY